MAAQSEKMETDEVMEELDGKVIGDEQREEPQEEAEAEEDEDEVEDEVEEDEIPGEDHPAAEGKKKRSKNPPKSFTRELGKSVLPFARVQKIIRADKEIPMVAKDAVFLISIATEAFIEELAQAAQRVADKYNRSMIHHEDIATVARKADEFMFLEDIMPWTKSGPEVKRNKGAGVKDGNTVTESDM